MSARLQHAGPGSHRRLAWAVEDLLSPFKEGRQASSLLSNRGHVTAKEKLSRSNTAPPKDNLENLAHYGCRRTEQSCEHLGFGEAASCLSQRQWQRCAVGSCRGFVPEGCSCSDSPQAPSHCQGATLVSFAAWHCKVPSLAIQRRLIPF